MDFKGGKTMKKQNTTYIKTGIIGLTDRRCKTWLEASSQVQNVLRIYSTVASLYYIVIDIIKI